MIEVDEARRRILEEAHVLDEVETGLDAALKRVLAEDVVADRDFPPTDRSSMDGFAVRWEDVAEPGRSLEVRGEVRAGQPVGDLSVGPGQCVRIMTGAIVPPGADTVVMVELASEDGAAGRVVLAGEAVSGQHIRTRGEDLRAGETVLKRGAPIHAAEVAALAAVGRTTVRVVRPPLVGILSTGDEVVDAGTLPEPHQVRNSNAHCLGAQLREIGLTGIDLGIAPDTSADLRRALHRGLESDVLLITGGVSMGEYDVVEEALGAEGLRTLFHNVAIRPGKPILAGRIRSCLVVGLPGNPVSTFTDFAEFVAPALRKMMGYPRWDNLGVEAELVARLKRKPGRTTYHLARVSQERGGFKALPVRTMGSGDVLSMHRANGFVVTPGEAHALEAGATVQAELWTDFHLR
jgi:molybdopterin molybdotransferase